MQLENKIFNFFEPWYTGFKHISIDIIGHEVVFDNDSKIHTVYLISMNGNISKGNSSTDEPDPRGVILKKRYNEFNALDKQIRKFMKRN